MNLFLLWRLNMTIDTLLLKISSRKYQLSLIAIIMGFVGLMMGKIVDVQFVILILGILGSYGYFNVGKKKEVINRDKEN
jgi:hypothetical protein